MLKPKHVKQTVKHDDTIMAWGCFNYARVDDLHHKEGNMNAAMYIRILSSHIIPFARRLFSGDFVFQFDSKHTAKRVSKYLID